MKWNLLLYRINPLILHPPPGSFESIKLDEVGTLRPPGRKVRKDESTLNRLCLSHWPGEWMILADAT